MTAHHIRHRLDDDGMAVITIDRPEKRNAMTWAMLQAFNAAVAAVSADEKVRVVIVTGAPGAFCAGTDLSDLNEPRPANAAPAAARGRAAPTPSPGRCCAAPSP